ncbi:hypothetical protein N0V88_007911 [Collariella sp. IMI 366227]|nr:hypothetical protein N0V88_007911 [Collariella sp. IMI 366227]
MAAAVTVPLFTIHGELGGVLPPSAVAQHSPRHGRSRAMSMKGKGGRGRGYSVVEQRDVTVAKALLFVIKRAIQQADMEEEDGESCLISDPEGWVSVTDVTEPRSDNLACWQISRITNREIASPSIPVGHKLASETPDLPEFVIYETSYQRYPLLVALGAITRAPGSSQYRTFVPVMVSEDGIESRQSPVMGEAADVSVWIHLPTALQTEPAISWHLSDTGMIITADNVPKRLWAKAVARRPDLGILFEDGQVRKDVPAGLRRKGSKGKARNGKGALKREGSGDDSGSASEK